MRRLAVAATVVVLLALPVWAQRIAGRGGFSGHSAPASRAGNSAPQGFSGMRGGYAPRRVVAAPRSYVGAGDAFRRRPPYRPPHSPSYPPAYGAGSRRYRRPYWSPYGAVVPYGVSGWIAPYYLGSSDEGDDGASAPANPAAGEDDQQAEQQAPPWPSDTEQGPPAVLPAYASAPPVSEAAVTLIFKDGRAPEQIHNYLLTRETLFVGDRHPSEIPVEQLDLTATAKVNRDAGIDFRLPQESR